MAARHRVIIVGAGSIGERHLRCFLATGRVEVAFVEPREAARRDVAERYPAAKAFETVDEGIEVQRPTAAVVATPAPLHVPLATKLVERGVHVLIEKPLSLSIAGIHELTTTAIARNAVVAVAYVYRAHPALAAMRSAIAAGQFGEPLEMVVIAGQCFPFYRPAYRQTYYARRESGGGAVQDALTHLLDAGRWLLGKPIDRVVGDAAHQAIVGVEVEDTVHAIARHGRVLASYSLNQHQAPNELTITVICERGTARFEYHSNRWRSMTEPGGAWAEHEMEPLERDSLFTRQANAFLEAIEGTSPPLCSLADGIDTLNATMALLRGLDTGSWQSVGEEAIAS